MELTAVGEHTKKNLERYAFVCKYPTHVETWNVVQTDHPKGEEAFADGRSQYLKTMGFMDYENNWWLIWHAFVHTNARADEWLTREIQECADWDDSNMWYGEL